MKRKNSLPYIWCGRLSFSFSGYLGMNPTFFWTLRRVRAAV
jgi:hypothetical protein